MSNPLNFQPEVQHQSNGHWHDPSHLQPEDPGLPAGGDSAEISRCETSPVPESTSKSLREKTSALEVELQNALASIDAFRLQAGRDKHEIASLKEDLQSSRAEIGMLVKTVEARDRQIEDIEDDVQELRGKNELLQNALGAIRMEQTDLIVQLQMLTGQESTIRESIRETKQEFLNWEQRISQLDAEKRAEAQKTAEFAQQLAEWQEEALKLRRTIKSAEQEKTVGKAKLEDLQRKLVAQTRDTKQKLTLLEDRIEKLKELLKKTANDFDRTIRSSRWKIGSMVLFRKRFTKEQLKQKTRDRILDEYKQFCVAQKKL